MYYLIYILFLISLLSLPFKLVLYSALILITLSLTILFFSRKPDSLTPNTIKHMRKVVIIYGLFGLIFLILEHKSSILYLSLLAVLPYLYFGIKERKSPRFQMREDKRRALRTDLYFDVELRSLSDTSSHRGVTRDISTTGMRVFTPKPLEKGKEFYFRIYLPEEVWPLTGKAEVVWQKPVEEGFEHGMVFIQISDQDRGKIALKQGFSLLK